MDAHTTNIHSSVPNGKQATTVVHIKVVAPPKPVGEISFCKGAFKVDVFHRPNRVQRFFVKHLLGIEYADKKCDKI